jgi:hypothetical protein
MPTMTDHSRRILELLAQGKITVDEAEQLLRAIDPRVEEPDVRAAAAADQARPRQAAKWLRVTIEKMREGRDPKQVSIRVPMALVRGGVKLGALFPQLAPVGKHLREQGIDVDFSKVDFAQIEQVLDNLGETTIDVDDGKGRVKITCE